MDKKVRYKFIFIIIVLVVCWLNSISSPDSLKLLINKNTGENKINLYVEIAKANLSVNPDTVILYSGYALKYSHNIDNQKYIPELYQLLGYAHYYKRNFSKSINYLKQALSLFEKTNNKKKISDINAYIGIVYQDSYNYDKSLNYFYKALNYYNELNDSLNISAINNNLGLLFFKTGDYTKALYYLNRSLDVAKRNNLLKSAAYSLNNLSLIYKNKNNYKLALEYLIESQEILIKLNEKNNLVVAKENIGETYLKLKNFSQALNYFNEALLLARKLNDKINEASLLLNIANAYIQKNQYSEAKIYLNQAGSIIIEHPDLGIEMGFYKALSNYYQLKKDSKNALINLKKYKILNDSVFSKESAEKLAELKIRYETNEIETENEILKQSNQVQEIFIEKQNYIRNIYIIIIIFAIFVVLFLFYSYLQKKKATMVLIEKNRLIIDQRKRLEEANITKDKFFSIIAHDLKTPFYNIKYFSNLLYNNGLRDEKQKREILNDLKTMSDDTFSLLDNLLTWANSQSGAIELNVQELDLLFVVTESIRPYKMSAFEKKIDIKIDIAPDIKIVADKYTITTVIGNLFYNAVKFTNKYGLISIYTEKENDNIILSIKDSGIGINQDEIGRLFKIGNKNSTYGTNNEKGSGLGLVICKEFVDLNKGEIQVNSKINEGSTFSIVLKSK